MKTRTLIVALVALLGVGIAGGAARPALAGGTSQTRIESIQIGRAPDGRGFAVEFRALVHAPAAAVVQALADVSALPSWAPKIEAVGRVALRDDTSLTFDSTVRLPWPVGAVHETILAERHDEDGSVRLRWQHVVGDMRRNVAVWTVTPIDAEHSRVHYEARLWFRAWLPTFLLRLAEKDYAPWFMYCLERRANDIAATPAAVQNSAATDRPTL